MGLGLVTLRSLLSNGHTIPRPLYTLDNRDTLPALLQIFCSYFHLMEQSLTTHLLSQVLFDVPMNCRKEQLCHYKKSRTITKLLLTGSAALLELCVDLLESWMPSEDLSLSLTRTFDKEHPGSLQIILPML